MTCFDNTHTTLNDMYEGRRDASSSIRGFLYQDLIAIEELLDSNTNHILIEFVEDVTTLSNDGSIKIIQSKYYQDSTFSMNSVIINLYAQYKKLSKLKDIAIIPTLIVFTKKPPSKPSLNEVIAMLSSKAIEDECFELIKKFYTTLEVTTNKGNYSDFRTKIIKQLIETFPSNHSDEDYFGNILFGLSAKYIQSSYVSATTSDTVAIRKLQASVFKEHLHNAVNNDYNEDIITAYIQQLVDELYHEILEENIIICNSNRQTLYIVSTHTKEWLGNLCNNVTGQLQLLNTVSIKKNFDNFVSNTVQQRLAKVHEHSERITSFLRTFWKIITDISLKTCDQLNNDSPLLNPSEYISHNHNSYLELSFDKSIVPANSILLSIIETGRYNANIETIFERISKLEPTSRPKNWYMRGTVRYSSSTQYSYDQDVSDIRQGKIVSKPSEQTFKIGCLDCIKVDMGDWSKQDDCYGTIFSEKCIRQENKNG